MNSLSPHLAYQMTGNHRFIAINAESPNVSKHSDGMSAYWQLLTYLLTVSSDCRQKKWICGWVLANSCILDSLLPAPKTNNSKGIF